MIRTVIHTGLFLALAAAAPAARAARPEPFAIQVVDEQTGRGVPLVELKSVSNLRFYTDSAGLVAIDDPALMGRLVFFHVHSDGYEIRADGFGNRCKRIQVTPGGAGKLAIKRVNLAEAVLRLNREGLYADSGG